MDLTIPPLDDDAMATAYEASRQRHGKLDGLAVWLAGAQGVSPPRPLARRRTVAFGDSPVAADVTGGGTFEDGLVLADAEVDAGADVVVVVGRPDDRTYALVAALTGAEPVEVVAQGRRWATVVGVVRDALRTTRGMGPMDLVEALGDPAMTGFLAGAARRRTPVLLDGVAPAAAALAAARVAPGAEAYFAAGHLTPEPAHRQALAALGLAPLLDLGIKADGGALLALPLLDAAVALLARDEG